MLQHCSLASHLLKINLLKNCSMCLWLLTTEDNERGIEHTKIKDESTITQNKSHDGKSIFICYMYEIRFCINTYYVVSHGVC